MSNATDTINGCRADLGMSTGDASLSSMTGEPIAVAFTPSGSIVVQSREPAMLELSTGERIQLASETREDTGHALFHSNSGGFIACASCHAEGNDDGRVWKFSEPCVGATPRRTQSLQTGLRGTEPFHWTGEEHDFPALVQDVFVGRMSGPTLAPDQMNATLTWIDAQPRPALSPPADLAAVDRGRALFADTARAGCASCHNGDHLTNNQTIDVGTGGAFQVPSLVGIGSRGPYLHDGCAQTLRDRFDASCGGGDKHGMTSVLSDGEISDLVSYLGTL
jgi:mono/diheme cytochrome c family protein